MMNETKRNEISELCESLSQDELIELCKKLIAENEALISAIEEREVINRVFALANGISKVVIERK